MCYNLQIFNEISVISQIKRKYMVIVSNAIIKSIVI